MSHSAETVWYGQPALVLENTALRVIAVPGMGAKIVSVYHKTAEYEWLLGPADRPFHPVAYGASFVDQDMSGWDDMFPTINACTYPVAGPQAGAALPDHGEVWALPWEIVEASESVVSLRVNGRALPYQIIRTMSLPTSHTLRMDYTVVNTGSTPLAGLWAAHPQFVATSATEIRLPPEVESALVIHPIADWNPTASQHPWPTTPGPDGRSFRLDRVTSAAAKRSRKLYALPDQPVCWAMLAETGANHWLRMDWDAAQVPYLGIWVDEGDYNPALTIALEPSTGFYDSLELAWENQRVPVVAPGSQIHWSITVTVGID